MLHRRIKLGLQLALLLGLAVELYEAQWMNATLVLAILIVSFLPRWLARGLELSVPPQMELLAIGFVFASVFLGETRDFYGRFWWWDVLLHATSGGLLGAFGFLLVYVLNETPRIELRMRPPLPRAVRLLLRGHDRDRLGDLRVRRRSPLRDDDAETDRPRPIGSHRHDGGPDRRRDRGRGRRRARLSIGEARGGILDRPGHRSVRRGESEALPGALPAKAERDRGGDPGETVDGAGVGAGGSDPVAGSALIAGSIGDTPSAPSNAAGTYRRDSSRRCSAPGTPPPRPASPGARAPRRRAVRR